MARQLVELAVAVALLGRLLFAEHLQPEPPIRLITYNRAGVPLRTLERAQQGVSFIFKRIGVNTKWVKETDAHLKIILVDKLVDDAVSSEDVFGHARSQGSR